jgi:uncharacterized protein (TIGR03437 family)
VRAGIPALYSTPTAHVAALNQDGSVNSADHPAQVGSVVALFLTGLGPLSPPVADGTIFGDTSLPALVNEIRVRFPSPPGSPFQIPSPIPTVNAEVLYAGPAPFSVAGFYQVNIRIPVLSDLRQPGQRQLQVLLNPPGGPVVLSNYPTYIDVAPAP